MYNVFIIINNFIWLLLLHKLELFIVWFAYSDIWAAITEAHPLKEGTYFRPHCKLVLLLHPFSVRGQTDDSGGSRSWWRRADGAVSTQHPAGPKPAAPDSVHAGAAVPAGAGVRQGELRLQAPPLRAGHGAQPTGDNDQGTVAIGSNSVRWSVL